jgi:uncharacterized iron-regulated membrane protein
MSRIVLMYLLGFAGMWTMVAIVSATVAGFRHFKRDWDRAFERELSGRHHDDIDLRRTRES